MQRTNLVGTRSLLSSLQPGCRPRLLPCGLGTAAYCCAMSSELRRSAGTPPVCNVNGVDCKACTTINCLWCNGRPRQTSLGCWAHKGRHEGGPQVYGRGPAGARELKLREGACILTEKAHRPLSERHRRSRPSHKDRPVLWMLVAQHPHPYAVFPPQREHA